jgi:protein-tyrosine phosphatase
MSRVLFVCTGNICRSPVAEGIMRARLQDSVLGCDSWIVDSAGTHAQYGQPPEPLAIESAATHGADIAQLRSRRFTSADFALCDRIIALDRGHLDFIEALRPRDFQGTVALLSGPHGSAIEVPDPYGRRLRHFLAAAGLISTGIDLLIGAIAGEKSRRNG